jgi:hypothetical protein
MEGRNPMTPVELAHKAIVRGEARKAKEAVKEARSEVAAGNQMISHQIRAACKEAEEAREEVETAQSQVFHGDGLRKTSLSDYERPVCEGYREVKIYGGERNGYCHVRRTLPGGSRS